MSIDPRITEAFEAANGFPLEPNLVVLALMGSHSHGTYLPPEDANAIDDIDLMGFVVPPIEYHLGLARWQHWTAQSAASAFSGYALDQLKRMEAFDLDRMAEYESLTSQITGAGPVKEVLEAGAERMAHISQQWSIDLSVLQRFRKLHREHFSGYMGEKRKKMVRRYQYDVKNAAHLIRLLRMGAELWKLERFTCTGHTTPTS